MGVFSGSWKDSKALRGVEGPGLSALGVDSGFLTLAGVPVPGHL